MVKRQDFSRREFFKHSSLSGLGILTLGSNSDYGTVIIPSEEAKNPVKKINKIAGVSLEQLRDKYRKELFENFIPNMDKYAIDHEYGGVMCSLDVRSGHLENKNKTAWFVGRGMWVYSFLYNNLEQNSRYLEIARKSKDLLLKLQPTDKSFWAARFTREGNPLSGPGDIYGSLFVAEGLFEYARASGEKKYRDLARKIIFDCVERYDQPDYSYDITYLRNAPQIKGPRVLGHWMLFLSLSTQMLKHEPDADLEKLAARCVDAIMNYHVNKNYGLTNEYINHDFSLPDNEYAQFSVIGHGLETLAFVMFEAARIKDSRLFHAAETVFKKHVDVAADALYGGYFHSLQHVDNYTWSLGKSLWCQQEVLNGTLFLIEHTGDEWAQRHFERTDKYIYEKFFNPDNKFWHSGGDRKMSDPNISLMEHYHHARQLMLGILSVERIINRGSKISGLFD
jgi:mannose/cellobiose epimerase-like protein (N-acyl-D-glucosamine 2-epimerase family)